MHIRKFALAAGLTAVLAMPAMMPAMAQSGTTKPGAAAKAVMPASTQTFVQNAGLTNLFEIEAGTIAQRKSDNGEVQDYAKMIVDDHRKAQDDLTAAAQDLKGASVPSSLDEQHSKMIRQLQAASGAEFLKTFKEQQVEGHKQAIKLFQDYAQGAANDHLKQFAQSTLPALQKHLRQAQNLPTTAGAPTTGSGGQLNNQTNERMNEQRK